jgi:hypothetical protein
MTHEDRGHYAKKHSPDLKVQPEIAEVLNNKASNRKISCAVAHKIARDLNVSPAEVGLTTDILEIRIVKCQLGLHGYYPEKRIVKPAETVSRTLEKAIRNSLLDGKLKCAPAWDIAKSLKIARMDVSAACEALKIKISSCQLGAF